MQKPPLFFQKNFKPKHWKVTLANPHIDHPTCCPTSKYPQQNIINFFKCPKTTPANQSNDPLVDHQQQKLAELSRRHGQIEPSRKPPASSPGVRLRPPLWEAYVSPFSLAGGRGAARRPLLRSASPIDNAPYGRRPLTAIFAWRGFARVRTASNGSSRFTVRFDGFDAVFLQYDARKASPFVERGFVCFRMVVLCLCAVVWFFFFFNKYDMEFVNLFLA